MSFSLEGVRALEYRLASLRQSDILAWLKHGLALIDSNDPVARRGAFPPLALYPDRELLAQIGTALREIRKARLRGADRLQRIVTERLRDVAVLAEERPTTLTRFWQLLGSVGCKAEIFALACKFLERVLKARPDGLFGEDREALDALVAAVVGAVASASPASQVQSSFFAFVHDQPELWRDIYVDVVIDSVFAQLERPRRAAFDDTAARVAAWTQLRKDYGAAIDARADPGKPSGRALLRSIARHLRFSNDKAGSTADVVELRELLWALEAEPAAAVVEEFEMVLEL
jgi:hypothetical protein